MYCSTVENDLIGIIESIEGGSLKKGLSFGDNWKIKD